MADDKSRTLIVRVFHGSLLILGTVVALWLALRLLATFWGWIALAVGLALVIAIGIWLFRLWRERRW